MCRWGFLLLVAVGVGAVQWRRRMRAEVLNARVITWSDQKGVAARGVSAVEWGRGKELPAKIARKQASRVEIE